LNGAGAVGRVQYRVKFSSKNRVGGGSIEEGRQFVVKEVLSFSFFVLSRMEHTR